MVNPQTSCFQFNQCPKSLAHPRWGAYIPQYAEDNSKVGSHSSCTDQVLVPLGERRNTLQWLLVTLKSPWHTGNCWGVCARPWAPRECFTVRYVVPTTNVPLHWAASLGDRVVLDIWASGATHDAVSDRDKQKLDLHIHHGAAAERLWIAVVWPQLGRKHLVLLLSISIPEE